MPTFAVRVKRAEIIRVIVDAEDIDSASSRALELCDEEAELEVNEQFTDDDYLESEIIDVREVEE